MTPWLSGAWSSVPSVGPEGADGAYERWFDDKSMLLLLCKLRCDESPRLKSGLFHQSVRYIAVSSVVSRRCLWIELRRKEWWMLWLWTAEYPSKLSDMPDATGKEVRWVVGEM